MPDADAGADAVEDADEAADARAAADEDDERAAADEDDDDDEHPTTPAIGTTAAACKTVRRETMGDGDADGRGSLIPTMMHPPRPRRPRQNQGGDASADKPAARIASTGAA